MTNPTKSKKKPLFLSWLQLKKERARLLVAIAGISFADVLMFLQMGFHRHRNQRTPSSDTRTFQT